MCFHKKKKVEPVKETKPNKPEPAPAKKAEPKPVVKEEPKVNSAAQGKRSYHVVKREDGKWEVKFAGGKKAIKLFDTQAEAVEYTKAMAANQDGAMLVHNSKGKNKGRIKAK